MIEEISQATASAAASAPALSPTAVDRSGSAEFEDAMTGALQRPEGGCQCEARASAAQPVTAAGASPMSSPASARSGLASLGNPLGPAASVDRSTAVSSQVTESAEPSSCGECGLPFSLDDVVGPVINAAVAPATSFIGIPTGWTFAGPSRPSRSATFEV